MISSIGSSTAVALSATLGSKFKSPKRAVVLQKNKVPSNKIGCRGDYKVVYCRVIRSGKTSEATYS